MLTGVGMLTSCLSDNDDDNNNTYPVIVSNGVYVVCGGNMSSNIEGSLTYYDYKTKAASQKVFQAKNGRGLGAQSSPHQKWSGTDGQRCLGVRQQEVYRSGRRTLGGSGGRQNAAEHQAYQYDRADGY